MPLTEEERRRCCILGGCGCQPGGGAQRTAMETWLNAKLTAVPEGQTITARHVKQWLDDLFTPASHVLASSAGDFVLGDEPVEIDLDLNRDDGG